MTNIVQIVQLMLSRIVMMEADMRRAPALTLASLGMNQVIDLGRMKGPWVVNPYTTLSPSSP